MRKTGGTGTSTLTAPFINNGDVQVQSGTLAFTGGGPAATGQFEVSANTTLQFASGGFTFNPPASLTGAGTLLVSGGTVNWSGIGSLAGTNFITSSGTLNVMTPGSLAVTNLIVNGALGGSGPVTVNGPFVWNSGTIISDGGVTLNGTGSLNGIGTATLYLNGLLRNAGQLTWGGSGANLYCQGSGLLTNLPTGTLNKARFFHTATLLPSGKVLVAGGYGTNNDILFSAELYDPASGIWTATGAMNTNRAAHTATLLPNGSVLVAGGFPNGGYLSSAELYDPVNPSGYNQMTSQLLSGSKIRLSFTGDSGANYALDHTFNLAPVNWVPQATNPAGAGGVLQFTNTPNAATNNFWRIRSVP